MREKIDILIKDGLVYDGTGRESFAADMGISGDRIVFIRKHSAAGNRLSEIRAGKVIEAKDLVVAPGFIDTHAHSEFTLLADPRAEGKICQGITTEINGNCGLSAAPLYGEAFAQREKDLDEFNISERWTTLTEYFGILGKRNISPNFVTLAGHGNIRASVIGYENRKPDKNELRKMKELLRETVADGAAGLSTGLIYPPGVYSDTEELTELCKALSHFSPISASGKSPSRHSTKRGKGRGTGSIDKYGVYTSHMRSEGDKLIESTEEILKIAEEAGIPVHISHIKTSGGKNWHKIDSVLSMIEKALKSGIRVTCDRYPYTASSTDLDTVLPSWAYEGGAENEAGRLINPVIKEKIKQEVLSGHPERHYWENIRISSVSSRKNNWMEGKSIACIAEREGLAPVDMLFKILVEEKLRVGAIFMSMNDDNLKRFLTLPYSMIGTDSSARSTDGPTHRGKPHPRGFGSIPRFLGTYVRDGSLMSLGEAIYKTTMLPAGTFGIRDRGVLKKGAFADIVVFDYKKLTDKATFEKPFAKPEGVYYVIVNGTPALWEGKMTYIRAGRILRHGK